MQCPVTGLSMRRGDSLKEERSGGPPQSVARVLQILDALTCNPAGETLSGLSAMLHSPKTSLLNLLRGMIAENYVVQDGMFYQLGPQSFGLANAIVAAQGAPDLSAVARPFLRQLVDEVGETVVLAVLGPERDAAIYVEKIEAVASIRFSAPLGSRVPLYATASGRVLLAFRPATEIDAYLAKTRLVKISPATVTGKRELKAILHEVREEGVAIIRGEVESEVYGFAAPIFDANGQLAAAAVIGAPASRGAIKENILKKAVKKTAEAISRTNGYRDPSRSNSSASSRKEQTGTRRRSLLSA